MYLPCTYLSLVLTDFWHIFHERLTIRVYDYRFHFSANNKFGQNELTPDMIMFIPMAMMLSLYSCKTKLTRPLNNFIVLTVISLSSFSRRSVYGWWDTNIRLLSNYQAESVDDFLLCSVFVYAYNVSLLFPDHDHDRDQPQSPS